MSNKNGARRYFWLVVIIASLVICGMIYYLSMAQAKEDKESKLLETRLNEQISSAEGMKKSAQELSEENERLEKEILGLYKENKMIASFAELQMMYINGEDKERIKTLADEIDRSVLNPQQQKAYDTIVASLEE